MSVFLVGLGEAIYVMADGLTVEAGADDLLPLVVNIRLVIEVIGVLVGLVAVLSEVVKCLELVMGLTIETGDLLS